MTKENPKVLKLNSKGSPIFIDEAMQRGVEDYFRFLGSGGETGLDMWLFLGSGRSPEDNIGLIMDYSKFLISRNNKLSEDEIYSVVRKVTHYLNVGIEEYKSWSRGEII
jgi:hypothetical protein